MIANEDADDDHELMELIFLVGLYRKMRVTQAIKYVLIKLISAVIDKSDRAHFRPIIATDDVGPNDKLLHRHPHRHPHRHLQFVDCTGMLG